MTQKTTVTYLPHKSPMGPRVEVSPPGRGWRSLHGEAGDGDVGRGEGGDEAAQGAGGGGGRGSALTHAGAVLLGPAHLALGAVPAAGARAGLAGLVAGWKAERALLACSGPAPGARLRQPAVGGPCSVGGSKHRKRAKRPQQSPNSLPDRKPCSCDSQRPPGLPAPVGGAPLQTRAARDFL